MATVRCDNCGFENPPGALVCRRCRRRLRTRVEAGGPRRETEAQLTVVVAREMARLAWVITGVLVLGVLLALPLYRRIEPALIVIVAGIAALAVLGTVQAARVRAS